MLPLESLSTTVSACVAPGFTLKLVGVTVTVDTGTTAATDVPLEVPLMASTVAVITTDPGVSNVTSPVVLTDATPELEAHVIVFPEITFALASFGCATNWNWSPTSPLNTEGTTSTVTTTGAAATTVSVAAPVTPSAVALIAVIPGASNVTNPTAFTVAYDGVAEAHTTVRPTRIFPAASRSVAVNCCVLPTAPWEISGATVTDATGAGAAATTVPGTFVCTFLTDATIEKLPGANARTSPVALTVAIEELLERNVTEMPVIGLPAASSTCQESC